MAFAYQFLLSPWVQEQLYDQMTHGETVHKAVVRVLGEAADNPATVARALLFAQRMAKIKRA